jgi:L-ascorbate metabolism protein UlaG (beta-lactamase superfamily)
MKGTDKTSIRLIRNATVLIQVRGKRFLVDPMFGRKDSQPPIPWTNDTRYPLIDLPISETELKDMIREVDYVILTHLHPDHWDVEAQQRIPKSTPILCQEADVATLRRQGFTDLRSSSIEVLSDTLKIIHVPAQHGHGEWAEKMAPVTGYVIQSDDRNIYLTGDSVWYEGVKQVLAQYEPDIIIVNAGAAQFQVGEPITMTAEDVVQVARYSKKESCIMVVHMETVNHCYLKRSELRDYIKGADLSIPVCIPEDGEEYEFKF